jgi:hypothetical protein
MARPAGEWAETIQSTPHGLSQCGLGHSSSTEFHGEQGSFVVQDSPAGNGQFGCFRPGWMIGSG